MLIHNIVVPFITGIAVILFMVWTVAGFFSIFEKGVTRIMLLAVGFGFFAIWGVGALSIILIPKLHHIFNIF